MMVQMVCHITQLVWVAIEINCMIVGKICAKR